MGRKNDGPTNGDVMQALAVLEAAGATRQNESLTNGDTAITLVLVVPA